MREAMKGVRDTTINCIPVELTVDEISPEGVPIAYFDEQPIALPIGISLEESAIMPFFVDPGDSETYRVVDLDDMNVNDGMAYLNTCLNPEYSKEDPELYNAAIELFLDNLRQIRPVHRIGTRDYRFLTAEQHFADDSTIEFLCSKGFYKGRAYVKPSLVSYLAADFNDHGNYKAMAFNGEVWVNQVPDHYGNHFAGPVFVLKQTKVLKTRRRAIVQYMGIPVEVLKGKAKGELLKQLEEKKRTDKLTNLVDQLALQILTSHT